MRTIYTHAIRDELLPLQHNPAAAIPKPSRQRSLRRALTNPELAAINDIAATTGNDTPLDTLILRLHTETACRRGGALALHDNDIDPQWCLLRLREKNNTIRWQPASPTLIHALLRHRDHRGTRRPSPEPLLRYRDGTPITSRRYDGLWHRIGTQLPWAAAQGISTHDQRRDLPTSKNSTTTEPTPSINSTDTARCHALEVCGSWNSLVDIRP